MHNAIIAHDARAYKYGTMALGSKALQSYTDRTSKKHANRRSVVYCIDIYKAQTVLAQVQNEFAILGYSNTVTTTGDGMYLRCIATLA